MQQCGDMQYNLSELDMVHHGTWFWRLCKLVSSKTVESARVLTTEDETVWKDETQSD